MVKEELLLAELRRLVRRTVEDDAYVLSSTEWTDGEIVAVHETLRRHKGSPLDISPDVLEEVGRLADLEQGESDFLLWKWWWSAMGELEEEGHLVGTGRREDERLRVLARRCLRQVWDAQMLPHLNKEARKAVFYALRNPQVFKPAQGLPEVWSQEFDVEGTIYETYLAEVK